MRPMILKPRGFKIYIYAAKVSLKQQSLVYRRRGVIKAVVGQHCGDTMTTCCWWSDPD